MAALRFRGRRTRRLWKFGTATAVITAGLVLLVSAASGTLSGSTFNTTNGALTGSPRDWNPESTPPDPIVCPATEPGSGTNCGLDRSNHSSLDNALGQGAKEDDPSPTVVSGSIPPNKDD